MISPGKGQSAIKCRRWRRGKCTACLADFLWWKGSGRSSAVRGWLPAFGRWDAGPCAEEAGPQVGTGHSLTAKHLSNFVFCSPGWASCIPSHIESSAVFCFLGFFLLISNMLCFFGGFLFVCHYCSFWRITWVVFHKVYSICNTSWMNPTLRLLLC